MKKHLNVALWGVFSAMAFVMVGLSTPYLSHYASGIGMDQSIYHLIGREWLWNGTIPYAEYSDLKGPLHFFLFGLASLISPDSFAGMGILLSLWMGLGMLYAYKTANLFVNKLSSFAVICLYFYWTRWFLGNPADIIWGLQHIVLYYLLLYALGKLPEIGKRELFLLGCMAGVCILTKFNLVAFFIPVCLLGMIKGKPGIWRNILLITAGFASLILPFVLYFMYHGALDDLLEEYIITALRYGGVPFYESALYCRNVQLFNALTMLPATIVLPLPLHAGLGFVLLSLGMLLFKEKMPNNKPVALTVLAGLLLTIIANFIGPKYYDQYYISLIVFVFLSLLVSIICINKIKANWFKCAVVYGLVCSYAFIVCMANYFSYTKYSKPGSPGQILKQDLNEIAHITQNDDILVTAGLSSLISLYVTSNRTPQMKYFVPPQTPTGRGLYMGNIREYLTDKQPRYVLASVHESKEMEATMTALGFDFSRIRESDKKSAEPSILYELSRK